MGAFCVKSPEFRHRKGAFGAEGAKQRKGATLAGVPLCTYR
jgi:hypothetical protein